MRVLVTGSSGQLGSEIARQLAHGDEVVGIDAAPGRWTTHVADILDHGVVGPLLHGTDAVVHTASLHARHLAERTRQAFVDVNVTGTLRLLEAAAAAGVRRVVYTSTTSLYGFALEPTDRAVWVTEELAPRPRDVYDLTKIAAEELCRQVAAESGMTAVSLRTARFFPEPPARLARYRLYRGVDVRDAAAAHVLALTAPTPTFAVFNVAARSPFRESDLPELLRDAPAVVRRVAPEVALGFAERGWGLPASIDRVYVIERAERNLGFAPRYGAARCVDEAADASRRPDE